MGDLQSPPPVKTSTSPLVDFIRRLANFRHPSLKPFDPPEFAMIVREKTLTGGCRSPRGLPPLNTTEETRVPAATTYGFPTGADLTQVCDGTKRYTVLFRPVIPGDR